MLAWDALWEPNKSMIVIAAAAGAPPRNSLGDLTALLRRIWEGEEVGKKSEGKRGEVGRKGEGRETVSQVQLLESENNVFLIIRRL